MIEELFPEWKQFVQTAIKPIVINIGRTHAEQIV